MNFDIPEEMQAYLEELDQFIEKEIKPLENSDDNIRFFDHRREDARLEDGAGRNSFDNSLPSRLEILAHYWSCPRLTLRAPVGALKGWVLATLWLELALFTAPELCVLAVPEVASAEVQSKRLDTLPRDPPARRPHAGRCDLQLD